MLLVILGAGASYDSAPSYHPREPGGSQHHRPPLACELFQNRQLFAEAVINFADIEPLIPRLRNPPHGTAVEVLLETFRAQATDYPERHCQLAAVRYYLHFLLSQVGRFWHSVHHGVTNYRTLLDDIERWRCINGEQLCLVNFNYDMMLETALQSSGRQIHRMSDYIANTYKLIKIHGSVNWGHQVQNYADVGVDLERMNQWEIARTLIKRAADLKFGECFHIDTSLPMAKCLIEAGNQMVALFPAIALPVTSKSTFECPQDHLSCLRNFLPGVTKILTIGWRGQEEHFLEELRKHLGSPPRLMVVASNKTEAKQIGKNLVQAQVGTDVIAADGGFTDVIRSDQINSFLRSQ